MNKRNHTFRAIVMTLIAGLAPQVSPAGTPAATNPPPVRTYAVGKKVADFPMGEDLSTPEAAYVTITRAKIAEGPAAGARLSIAEIAARLARAPKVPMPPEQAGPLREAQVLEVQIAHGTNAAVFARISSTKGERVEYQSLQQESGRWLNRGNDGAATLAEARKRYASSLAYREAKRRLASRPAIANLEEHLKPFVEFLKREATDPRVFLLQALASRAVVVLGEVHNRPSYWAFNTALVRSPEFARETGVIYLEFPVNDQPLMDRFLAAPTNDPAPVVEMLRDMFEMGWPDQPTVEFCQAVWEVNQTLPRSQRLRLVLVDMARPWKEIQKREDWRKHDVDRDAFMAENILRDLREHRDDPRHALFIVGWMHAIKNLTRPGGEPMESAGQRLQAALGASNVLTVFPHCPVMANRGDVNGRLALGLFESAFAALTNRPMAFPLDRGPFGELPFDASMDFVTSDPYRAAFDAFLYLGPLENEIMSPLVPGFYTDDYAREVDRRCRLMNGKGLPKADGASLVALRSPWWGQPRRTWQTLGPLNAWEHGSDWEKKLTEARHRNALNDAAAIQQAAERLIQAIRKADYEHPGDWESFPAPDVDYTVHSDYPGWMQWVCQHFRTNPIVQVEMSEVLLNAKHLPCVDYQLTLRNGQTLEGTLPFRWSARRQRWGGEEGLDWHRR